MCLEQAGDHVEHDLVEDLRDRLIEHTSVYDLPEPLLPLVDEAHALHHLLFPDLVGEVKQGSCQVLARILPRGPPPLGNALEYRFHEPLDLVLAGLGVLAYGVIALEVHHCCGLRELIILVAEGDRANVLVKLVVQESALLQPRAHLEGVFRRESFLVGAVVVVRDAGAKVCDQGVKLGCVIRH